MKNDSSVRVYVPATSANLGAGFDCLGIALSLGNTVTLRQAEGCRITADSGDVPLGQENLIYKTAAKLYAVCGRSFYGLAIHQEDRIPQARGLGSSSACIAAGLLGANALLGSPLAQQELLDMAAAMEGHPDNVAPAFLGGCVAACMEGGRVYAVKKGIVPHWQFAALIPDFTLLTEKARAALPPRLAHGDAVYNLSRAALGQAALCENRPELLLVALGDRIHQPYRLPLIAGGEEVFALAKEAGAAGVYISGAGPTIMAVGEKSDAAFIPSMRELLQKAAAQNKPAGHFALLALEADNTGAVVL